MTRAERERIAADTKRGLLDAAARARRGAEQVAEMRMATAGSTHPDAVRVQELLALAERAPTHAERVNCLRSAWDFTKDYMRRGQSEGGRTTGDQRADAKVDRKAEVLRVAKQLWADNPSMSRASVARILSERGRGGEEALRKLLPARKRRK